MKKKCITAAVFAVIALIGLLRFINDGQAVNLGAFLFPLLIALALAAAALRDRRRGKA